MADVVKCDYCHKDIDRDKNIKEVYYPSVEETFFYCDDNCKDKDLVVERLKE